MKVYGLKTCDTCRKAVRALPGSVLVDVRDTPLPDAVLERALTTFGDALKNTRSTTWRGLSEDERKAPAETLLRKYPALMKRPLIEHQGDLYLGWTSETQAALSAGAP